jgi:LmbE family N-acetylglucosaminyl deacetylase
MESFNFYRNDTDTSHKVDLSKFLTDYQTDEKVLVVVPHDDDLNIGAGLMAMALNKENIPLTIAITTDGSMGYCTEEQRENIKSIRRKEMEISIKCLGLSNVKIIWCDYPDCDLPNHKGRRQDNTQPTTIAGHTGLQNTYTSILRDINPTRVFVCTGEDYHPDHKTVYEELLISIFHAGGDIWPELGTPLAALPKIYEMAVYCDFPEKPSLLLKASEEEFKKKLDSIYAFQSQRQIKSVVEAVENNGPYEFFREIDFKLYQPKTYLEDFNLS